MTPKAPGADCANCPGRDRPFVPPLPAFGKTHLAIVGEGPGRHEVERKEPFVGPSGRMMMHGVRHELGLGRRDVHWTNAVLCDVRERDLPEARKCCAERLRRELAEAASPVVMPVGAIGARSALLSTRPTPILKWRGSVSRVDYGDSTQAHGETGNGSDTAAAAWVLPTIHPAFVMRARQWGPVFEVDFARVGRVMRNGFTPPEDMPGRQLLIARTMPQLEEALHTMSACDDSGFDVETVGLGPTHTRLVCFCLSDGMTTTIIPWSQGRDGMVAWWQHPSRVAKMVSDFWRERRVVTHNGPAFDHIVAPRYELVINEWDDTLVASHAVTPELPKNLAHVVSMRIDVPPWKLQEDRTADLPRLWVYNGRDGLYMMLSWQQQKVDVT